MKPRLRLDPRRKGGRVEARTKLVDPRAHFVEREGVELAQRAREALGQRGHVGARVGLVRRAVRDAEAEDRLVLRAQIVERSACVVHAGIVARPTQAVSRGRPACGRAVNCHEMSDAKREVEELRQEIAKLDAQLLAALDKRARASRRIGELRKDQPASMPLNDRATIRALVARGSEMPQEALRTIFREVFAGSLALEMPVKVAYVGPEGGAGHAAARGRFGPSGALVAAESTAAAIEEVTRRRAEFAIVPFETSTDGPVQATILALAASELKICEQLEHSFELHLMNRTGNYADVEKVYATPADHALCAEALAPHAAKAAILDVRSPMMACQLAVEDHGAAALATEMFGAQLGLEVARRNVVDRGSDRVRYAVVGSRPSGRTGADVTAVVFTVQDAPGSLLDALRQFAERGVNLSKIQSRPMQDEAWSYLFFVEVAGHSTDRAVVSAFEEIRRGTRSFKVLGSYPALT